MRVDFINSHDAVVGSIELRGGSMQYTGSAARALQNINVIEPTTFRKLTPKDGEAYMRAVAGMLNPPYFYARLVDDTQVKDYSESQHPRDDHGRWTDSGNSDETFNNLISRLEFETTPTASELFDALSYESNVTSAEASAAFNHYNADEVKFENGDVVHTVVDGKTLYVVDDSFNLKEATDWVNEIDDPAVYWPDYADNFNRDFWESPSELYHATDSENLASVLENGLKASEDTRGMHNLNIGPAVFTVSDFEMGQGTLESYGDTILGIDTAAMKRDGYMPYVSQEPDVVRYDLSGATASRLGIDNYEPYEGGDSEDSNTVIIDGCIDAKYLRVVNAPDMSLAKSILRLAQVTKTAGPHNFSTTQVQVTEPYAAKVLELSAKIPDAELEISEGGRETDIHVTVFYGLHTESSFTVKAVLMDQPPVMLEFLGISLFPANDKHDYDVLKIDIKSDDLGRLHTLLKELPNSETFADYKPHCTIAYLRAGEGQKYVGAANALTGQVITVNKVTFVSSNGIDRVEIPLLGSVHEIGGLDHKYSEDQARDERGRWTSEGGEPWQMAKEEYTGEHPYQGYVESTPLPSDESLAAYHAKSQEWEQSTIAAISLGKLSPDQAHHLGLQGFNENLKPLPSVLYHVTTAADAVEAEGLKTRFELKQDEGTGLGGGDNKTVSFTESLDTAKSIADSFHEAHDVAAGTKSVAEMVQEAKDGTPKSFYDEVARHYGDVQLDAILHGKKIESGLFGPPDSPGNWVGYGEGWLGGDGQQHYASWERDETPAERIETAWRFYQTFSFFRDAAGGKLDPLFIWNDVAALAKMDTKQIGVMQYHPASPEVRGWRMGALGEWRTGTGKAVRLTKRV